jgi:hypothetical protein
MFFWHQDRAGKLCGIEQLPRRPIEKDVSATVAHSQNTR